MTFWDTVNVLLLGIALSMDAFAVAICKGLALKDVNAKKASVVGIWFGGFQALMPLAGYFIIDLITRFLSDTSVYSYVERLDHWIALILLSAIGINMIREANDEKAASSENASLSFLTMLVMAIATSIDALATGMAMRMDGETNIFVAVAVIGVTTFILSFVGVKAGGYIGSKFRKKAQICGGVVLILIGLKIAVEHMFF